MLLNKPIKTTRLFLKNLEPADASGLYKEWVNDPEVNRFLEIRRSPPDNVKLSKFISKMNDSDNNLLLGIFLQNGAHIGNIKLGPINTSSYRGMIGLLIGDKNYWGKGFATEAIVAISNYAFEFLNLNRVEAGLYSSNIASLKAFFKAGFEEEGRLKSYWKIDDGWADEILVGRVKKYSEVKGLR